MRNEMSGQDVCVFAPDSKDTSLYLTLTSDPPGTEGYFPNIISSSGSIWYYFTPRTLSGHVTSSLALRIYRFSIKAWGAPR